VAGSTLTLAGTGLPTPTSVSVGGTKCGTPTKKSATEIVCTLPNTLSAGNWDASIQTATGSVPIKAGTAKIVAALTVTSVTPATNLNQMGGDVLTIAGTGFDAENIASNTVALTDGTKCPVSTVTSTQIKCTTEKLVKTTAEDIAKANPVIVTVNSITNNSQTVKASTTKKAAEGVSPASVSPVLHTKVTITLAASYTGTLTIKDTTVNLHGTDKKGKATLRRMYITAVNNTGKRTIQIKFPGAVSGDYTLTVSTKLDGAIDSSALALKVIGEITNFSPVEGSNMGGTLFTITGRHFSTDILDNPVTIGGAGSKGNIKCLLVSSSDTTIKCRTPTEPHIGTNDGLVLAFLKLSEEAKCNASAPNGCKLKWVAPPLDVQSGAVTFDTTSKTYKLAITTTSDKPFTKDDTTGTELWLDGTKQTTSSVTATVATFVITHLADTTAATVQLATALGYVSKASITAIGAVKATPTLLEISPTVGSTGGAYISVTGGGFGTSSTVMLIAGGKDVCSKVQITKFGHFFCTTKAEVIAKGAKLELKVGSTKYDCQAGATKCIYSQETATSPNISTITRTKDKVTIGVTTAGLPDKDTFDAILTF